MASVIPDTKIIYILRDPLERIVSHYIHLWSDGKERRSRSEALADYDKENNRYLLRSLYYKQLKQFLDYFPPANIFVITLEDLNNQFSAVMQ